MKQRSILSNKKAAKIKGEMGEQIYYHEASEREAHLASACLGNSLILRKVLSNLSNADLLRCTLVSKSWNYEARTILRDKRKIIAYIRSANPCGDLKSLEADVGAMSVIPFNGLRLNLDSRTHSSIPSRCLGPNISFDLLVSKLPLKYLEINWRVSRKKIDNCSSVLLIAKILAMNRLVEIFFRFPDYFPMSLSSISNGPIQLPALKVLKFPRQGILETHLNTVKNLVLRAPCLQEFHHDGSLPFVDVLLQLNKASLIKCFEFNAVRDNFNEKFSSCQPELRELKVQCDDLVSFNVAKFSEALGRLLASSSESLASLKIDLAFLIHIMKLGVTLKNLGKLEISIDCPRLHIGQPVLLCLLRSFNFSSTFPRLISIDFRDGSARLPSEVLNELIQDIKDAGCTDQETYTSRITHISLHGCLKSHTAQIFSEIFPRIRSLYVSFNAIHEMMFHEIWSRWPKLRQILLGARGNSTVGPNRWIRQDFNLDAAFCGIHPEEVADLKCREDNFLRQVHIVPSRPSIIHLQGLRKLGICLKDLGSTNVSISRVAALIAFKRLSGLGVIVATDGVNVMEDLVANGLATVLFSSPHETVVECSPCNVITNK